MHFVHYILLILILLTSCQQTNDVFDRLDFVESVVIMNEDPITLSMGSQDTIDFRIRPSNATISMSEDNCQIELGKVEAAQTGVICGATPDYYRLVHLEQAYDEETKEKLDGHYRVIIEDTKISAEYEETAYLMLKIKNPDGSITKIISDTFTIKGKNYEYLPKTGLPIIIISTPDSASIVSKTDWMDGASMTILNADMSYDYMGTLSIKGRGNTTWGYPKKPYALKLDKKEKLLGMAKHKRWCLLANWIDRTLMRNAVAFEISRYTDLAWTPDGRFVEVILNNKHIGNYYLCEQIKVDENRINIIPIDTSVTEGEGITGGYVFELDTSYDERFKFKPIRTSYPWMFKEPDEVNQAQYNWAVNYVNDMEDALYDVTRFKNREFENYMNLESYVDWWFVTELAMNAEAYWPKSCYMYKDINGKMTAGPVWDFDWGTFTPDRSSSFCCKKYLYYQRLFEDAAFVALVKTRWALFKSDFESKIPAFIDTLKEELKPSDFINSQMWPIRGSKPNGDEDMSFDETVERLKKAYLDKLSWLDGMIQSW